MRTLEAGHRLNPDDIGPLVAVSGEPITITGELGPSPLGFRYRAKHVNRALIVSAFDRDLLADALTRRRLEQGLGEATTATHERILQTHGFTFEGVIPFAVHDDPRCTTVAEFVQRRLKKAKLPSLRTAMRLVDQACEAFEYLHPNVTHGLISGQTSFVDAQGQLKLFGLGEGGAAWRSPRYSDHVAEGRLPRPGDEVDPSREPSVASDVYLLAALMIEILTGRAYQDPRQLDVLRTTFAREGVDLLMRALNPKPNARPSSVANFRAALQGAMAATPAKARGSSMSRVSHASTLTTLSNVSQLAQVGPSMGEGSQVGAQPHPGGYPPRQQHHTPLPGPFVQRPATGPFAPVPNTGPYAAVPNTGPYAAVPNQGYYPPGQHQGQHQGQHPGQHPGQHHNQHPGQHRGQQPAPQPELTLEAAERLDAQRDPYAGTTIGPAGPAGPPMRPPTPPSPPPRPQAQPQDPAPAPLQAGETGELGLGLGLGNIDELATRLESIDGAAGDGFSPTGDIDNSTPSTGEVGDSYDAPKVELTEEEFELALVTEQGSDGAHYLHVKDGVERGPFTAKQLVKLAEAGEVQSVDDLVHRKHDRTFLAAAHPKLRPIFVGRAEAAERDARKEAEALAAQREKSAHGRTTAMWVLGLLIVFGAAAAFIVLK